MDAADLAEIPLFADLGEQEREHFAKACHEMEVEADKTLIQEGDFGYSMFAVREGTAEVLHDDRVIRTLGPGDVFGEIAILTGGRRTASVVTRTPMRLIAVMNRDVWRLEEDDPEVGAALRSNIEGFLANTSS